MSKLQRPSSVDAITRAAAPKGDPVISQFELADAHEREEHKRRHAPVRVKPVRISLNLPPDLARELARWCDRRADSLEVTKVPQQEALRAMIRAVIDAGPEGAVLVGPWLRYELAPKSGEG